MESEDRIAKPDNKRSIHEYSAKKQAELQQKWSTMSSDEKNSLLPIVPDIISLNGEDSKYKKKVFHDIDEYRSFNIKESEKETEDYPADDESIFYHKRPHRDSVADLKVERIKEVRGDDEELVKGQEREEKNSASNVMNEDMITEEPTKPQIHIHYINSPQKSNSVNSGHHCLQRRRKGISLQFP